jgi:hypothetical protein
MKSTTMVPLLAACLLVVGCDSDKSKSTNTGAQGETKAEGSKDGAGKSGVKACDDYFAKVDECVKNAAPEAKTAMMQAAKSMRENLGRAKSAEARKAYATGCKQALAAVTTSCGK